MATNTLFSSENRTVCEKTWKKYCRDGQSADDKAQAHWMLDTYGYKHAFFFRKSFRF